MNYHGCRNYNVPIVCRPYIGGENHSFWTHHDTSILVCSITWKNSRLTVDPGPSKLLRLLFIFEGNGDSRHCKRQKWDSMPLLTGPGKYDSAAWAPGCKVCKHQAEGIDRRVWIDNFTPVNLMKYEKNRVHGRHWLTQLWVLGFDKPESE